VSDYKRLNALLRFIGYATYQNRNALVSSVYKSQIWEKPSLVSTLGQVDDSPLNRDRPRLLYLKSPVPTDASLLLSEEVQQAPYETIIDDPSETPTATLQWYFEHLQNADAMVAHFLGDDHKNARWHNYKCSLVCGLAHGLDKQVLMLAHNPYESPFDYLTLLRVHSRAADGQRYFL